jgi:hypothetical protein
MMTKEVPIPSSISGLTFSMPQKSPMVKSLSLSTVQYLQAWQEGRMIWFAKYILQYTSPYSECACSLPPAT